MEKKIIKNIFWDVDGVLADLNFAYYNFLKNHKNYKEMYRDLKWEDLDKALPIVEKYGALELKTHPTLGEQMDKDFCASPEFFNNRPLYPNVIKVLKELHEQGYNQCTMSATFDVETKTKLLKELFKDAPFLKIECVKHGTFMHDTAKEDMLKYCYQKYDLKPEETILADDRIYNLYSAINTGANPIRMRCEFTTSSPDELSWIPEVKDVVELQQWLKENTKIN